MRDIACADCVVAVLIGGHPAADRGGPVADRAVPSRYREAAAADPGRPGAAPSRDSAGTGAAHAPGTPGPEIGEPERRALRTLAAAGLIPPLRLVLPGADEGEPEFPDAEAS